MKVAVMVIALMIAVPAWADHMLTWTAPTKKTDGTKLTDLKGFRIGYDILPQGAPCKPPKGLIRYWVDVGNTTKLDISTDPNFQIGLRYFFTIVAYTNQGEANMWGQQQSGLSSGACLTITPPNAYLNAPAGSGGSGSGYGNGYGYGSGYNNGGGYGYNDNGDGYGADADGGSAGSNQGIPPGSDVVSLGAATFATNGTSAVPTAHSATSGSNVALWRPKNGGPSENVQYVKFKPRPAVSMNSDQPSVPQTNSATANSPNAATAENSNGSVVSAGRSQHEIASSKKPIKAKHQIVYYVSAALAFFVALGWRHLS